MNTHTRTSATKRALVLTLTVGALAFSACAGDPKSSEGAPPAQDSGYWDGSLNPRPSEPDEPGEPGDPGVQRARDGESVRAPRAMGGEPAVPTV